MFMNLTNTIPTATTDTILNGVFEASIDWRKASIEMADVRNLPAMQALYGKDDDVVELEDSDTRIPTIAQINSRNKTHARLKRQDTIHHAQKRLKYFVSTVNPGYLTAHPEIAVMGRFKKRNPYDHTDSLYMSGFDAKKGGRIRDRRKKVDIRAELDEYYAMRQEEEDEAEKLRLEKEADRTRLIEAKTMVGTAIYDEVIAQENAEMELDYLERRVAELKGRMVYHEYVMEKLTTIQKELCELSELSEEEKDGLKYYINSL